MPQKRNQAARRRKAAMREPGAHAFPTLFKSVLLAFPICAAVGLLLVLLSTAILIKTADPDRYHLPAGVISLLLSAFLGGGIAARLHAKRAPVLCGACLGLLCFVFLTVMALILPHSATGSPAISLLLRLSLIPISIFGAMLFAQKRRKHHRH